MLKTERIVIMISESDGKIVKSLKAHECHKNTNTKISSIKQIHIIIIEFWYKIYSSLYFICFRTKNTTILYKYYYQCVIFYRCRFFYYGYFGNDNNIVAYLRFQYIICFVLILVSELFERESHLLRIVCFI